MQCQANGCAKNSSSSWAAYCNTHKSRDRRHGHPLQLAISQADLKPYVADVQRRMRKNAASPAWKILEGRWADLTAECSEQLRAQHSGRAVLGFEMKACELIVQLSQAVPHSKIVLEVLALYAMAYLDSRRFLSDKAFIFQLARRVRSLTNVHAGSWYDAKAGRTRRHYRELSPRVTEAMGRMIVDALGTAGVMLARLEIEDREKGKKATATLHAALTNLE